MEIDLKIGTLEITTLFPNFRNKYYEFPILGFSHDKWFGKTISIIIFGIEISFIRE